MSSTPSNSESPQSSEEGLSVHELPIVWQIVAGEVALIVWLYCCWFPLFVVLDQSTRFVQEMTNPWLRAALPAFGLCAFPVLGAAALVWNVRRLGRKYGQTEFAAWVSLAPLLIIPLGCLVLLEMALLGMMVGAGRGATIPRIFFWLLAIVAGLVPLAVSLGLFHWGWRRGWATPGVVKWGTRLLQVGAALIVIACALIVPAFKQVEARSRDKAVQSNARQLAYAADQYFMEHGVTTVAQSDLVGATNYVKALNLVDRESYPAYFTQGTTITITGVGGVRTITYQP